MDYPKKFESLTKAALISEGCCCERLPDQMTGRAGSTNPSDFIAYRRPHFFYIECKSCQQDQFDIRTAISEGQWIDLLKRSVYPGVHAGYLIWFVHTKQLPDSILWSSAKLMERLYKEKRSWGRAEFRQRLTPVKFTVCGEYPRMDGLVDTILRDRKR